MHLPSWVKAAACGAIFFFGAAASAQEQPAQTPPWKKPYAGDEAKGDPVLALWQFARGHELEDSSGHQLTLKLRGQSRFAEGGPFGGACLECFAGPTNSQPEGASTSEDPALSLPAAFTLELWIKPKPEFEKANLAFLLDKKYVFYEKAGPDLNRDFCFYLHAADHGLHRIVAYLGYEKNSAEYFSQDVKIETGQWQHIAFTYNGAGTGRFYLNGDPVGRTTYEGRGAVSPGYRPVTIGERVGDNYAPFAGYIAQVRICKGVLPAFLGRITISPEGGRTAFLRMEENCRLGVKVANDTAKPLRDLRVRVTAEGFEKELALPDLAADAVARFDVPVDSRLRPDRYTYKISVTGASDDGKLTAEARIPVTLAARQPDRLPVLAWDTCDVQKMVQLGYTQDITCFCDFVKIFNAHKVTDAMAPSDLAQWRKAMDDRLAAGLQTSVMIGANRDLLRYAEPAAWQKYLCVDRNGKPCAGGPLSNFFPEIIEFNYNVGASAAKSYGDHPALRSALMNSEMRDADKLSFGELEKAAYRKYSGREIPAEAQDTGGVLYRSIKNFPANRIVPDDDPVLTFYRWFWKEGDGWNHIATVTSRALKTHAPKGFWTWTEPAVRVPSIWGSGGDADVISTWTYTYPDPIKIGEATDELFAMADGHPGQKVMTHTQIIWYHGAVGSNDDIPAGKLAPWEKEQPEAQYITISPDNLREAFWCMISWPVQSLQYHGYDSLVPNNKKGGYRYTNSHAQEALARVTHEVAIPLGPMLLQVPDRKSDVALLQSFASQMFAARGTWGWSNSWEADVHLILQWAQIQPRIVYEETIQRDGLDAYQVLVMPYCDVLPQSVYEKIKQFQTRGGIVIADSKLAPALTPDILLTPRERSGHGDKDKQALQTMAAQLREQLDPFYQRYGESSNPDVVTRFRRYGDADYLFAINDHRTFGTYVGQHGKVMEDGLPATAQLSVRRKNAYVYDLLRHAAVETTPTQEGVQWQAEFGSADGHLYMITGRPISEMRVETSKGPKPGQPMTIQVRILDPQMKPVAAVVPVLVEIKDSTGRAAEFSGYYGAKDGELLIKADVAANDSPGMWNVKVTDLASGISRAESFSVAGI